MEEFDNVMNDIFSGGDPMMSQWFLVKNNYMPFLLCVFYVVFCTVIGPALMRNREPFDLRRLMILFNFSLVAIYICSIVSAIIYLPKATWYEFCIRIEVEGHPIYPLAVMGWFIYLIKYVEFFDTVFFILRKKDNQLSFLHLFHHAVVPLMGWAFIRTESNCVEAIPVIANNLVHIIMYTYYGLAAMGPELQKYLWWKKYLTQLQMAQFLFMIVFLSVIVPLMGCRLVKMVYVAFTGMISTFLYLFYQFYRANFQKKNV